MVINLADALILIEEHAQTIKELRAKAPNTAYTKCQWIQIRNGVTSTWVSSCGGRKLKETFNDCPICGSYVTKHFA